MHKIQGSGGLVFLLLITVALAFPGAHEGHGGVTPVVREARANGQNWRIAIGVVPADPVAGEEIRVEIKGTLLAGGGRADRVATEQLRVSIGGVPVVLAPTPVAGVHAAAYVVGSEGPQPIAVRLQDATADPLVQHSLNVRPGPASRLRPYVFLALLLLAASFAGVMLRGRSPTLEGAGRVRLAAAAAVAVTAAIAGTVVLSQGLARFFLPERTPSAVDWIEGAPTMVAGEVPARPQPSGARPAADVDAVAGMRARVVAAPDGIAEIVVPMPARVLPADSPVRIGRRVAAGQVLARLQPTYILHDALHLNNQRWPILQSMIDAKRRMLETQGLAERLRLAYESKAASANEAKATQGAAEAARQEYDRWRETLRMHDANLRGMEPGQVDIPAPIGGEIAAAHFTQGQLVYEGDPLFTIIDLARVWIEVKVPETAAADFKRRTISFSAPAFPSVPFIGRLQRVAAAVDPETRTVSHFYAVQNRNRLLRIGMLVHLRQESDAQPTS